MKIAIIGWGSLIWCPKSLHKHIGEWQTGGPCLPIEFSRISSGRRLTLVIDGKNGEVIPTRFAESRFCELDDAIAALANREGITKEENIKHGIGYTERDKKAETKFKKSDVIQEWVKQHNFDAAVWTALESNFSKKCWKEFSVQVATECLQKLSGREKDNAREYIENAPPEICTPLRRHLYEISWLKA